MSRISLVTGLAGVLVVAICASAYAEAPTTVTYEGMAMDAVGEPVQGSHDIQLRYLDEQGESDLLVEKQSQIGFKDGRFVVDLGVGTPIDSGSHTSLQQVFAENPEILMEISIDGTVQNPWVRLLPSGHSPASAAALAGPVLMGDEKLHWKGYESKSEITAIQAAILSPADDNAAGPVPVDGRQFTNPLVGKGLYLGESNPLRDLPLVDRVAMPELEGVEINPPRHETLYDDKGRRFGTTTEKVHDPAVSTAAPTGGSPPTLLNFEGIPHTGFAPPDTEGTVGPNHYIQVVNVAFAVYDKSGALIAGPTSTNALWAGFGGPCQNDNDGDAIFLYDEQADRFVLTQFAITTGQAVCFAISTTPDPTGTYHLYQFDALRFPDYYKLGVWPEAANNAFFMGTNSGFQGQYDVYAFDRASMLAGSPATFQAFQNFLNLMMPADLDGATPPPPGTPGIMYTFRDGGEPYFNSPPNDFLDIYEFDVDWATPGNSTFSNVQSFAPPALAEFNWTICGFFVQNCLPQPPPGIALDSGSWWAMQRLQYRNFGSHETLVGSWTVDVTGSPDHGAPRFFELQRPIPVNSPGGVLWSIHQQGTYAPDSDHRFFPSAAMDGSGNIAVGYSVTSATTNPSARYAVRAAGDPLGTLQPEASLIEGTGVETGVNRWGDYSSMEVDPADDCTFWFTTEYIETTGSFNWQTRIGTFMVPGCGGLAASPTSQSVCTSAGPAAYDLTLFEIFTGTTIMSVTGCPAGTVCSFDVNPVIFPETMTTFEVANLAAAGAGSYPMTVTATDSSDPGLTRDVNLGLEVFDMVSTGLAIDNPSDGATDVSVTPTLSWENAAQAQTYDVEVATDSGFTNIVFSRSGITTESVVVNPPIDSSTTHYWRVRAINPCGTSSWVTASFTTEAAPGDCAPGLLPQVEFFDDLESGTAGWTSGGTGNTWQTSSARTHSGNTAFWGEDLPSVTDQTLVTPSIDLSSAGSNLTLHFWNHQTIEDGGAGCYDAAVIEVSVNNGTTWTRLESELLTLPYDGEIDGGFENPLAGDNGWCGDPRDWTESIVDIDDFLIAQPEGTNMMFRFRLATDSSIGREGWYIDDVKVQSCATDPDGLPFEDGFEDGTTDAWDPVEP